MCITPLLGARLALCCSNHSLSKPTKSCTSRALHSAGGEHRLIEQINSKVSRDKSYDYVTH